MYKTPVTRIKQDLTLLAEESWMPLEVQAKHNIGLASGWLTLGLFTIVIGGAILWAAFTSIPEITRGEGKIISKIQKQIIQSLEGGLLKKMMVHEGDIVEPGQSLVTIDPTKAEALYDEISDKVVALKASQARLQAEINDTKPIFPDELAISHPKLLATEFNSYLSRKKGLDNAVLILLRNRDLIEKELDMIKPMADKGAISIVEVLRLERQSNELALQAEERKNKFKTDANAELLKITGELGQFEAQGKARKDMLDRAIIKSPVRGVITRIYSHTLGGVIGPGAAIMEISPMDDNLIVETKILPSDVAFLRPGLPASVRITAYDSSKYGNLKGTVMHVSPDTFEDLNARNPAKTEPYYHALVQTERNSLEKDGAILPIIPGMVASVDIETGSKTILEFILKPLHTVRSGVFSER